MDSHFYPAAARIATALLLASVIAACGGGGSDSPTTPPMPAGNVGPAGATITSADGNATLVIPPGALSATINVTLTPATPADGYADDPQIIPGTAYKLDAPETALAVSATLSIAQPASAAATANPHRAHTQAIVPAAGFIACYLQTYDPTQPSNYSYIDAFGPGADVPWTPQWNFVCAFDKEVYADGFENTTCPAGWTFQFDDHWYEPGYFTDDNEFTNPPNSGSGEVRVCDPAPDPVVNIVSLGALRAILGPAATPTPILTMGPQILALFRDSTPPFIAQSSTVVDAGNGMVKVHFEVTATDNTGVVKVEFAEQTVVSARLASTNTFAYVKNNVATFTAPPYAWDSAPMPHDQLYADHHSYAATAYDAAGNRNSVGQQFNALTPAITSFTANPATLPAGGGDVALTWTTPADTAANASDTVAIDHGIGNVTGSAGATAHITSTTTFTITGTNPSGTGTATVTVVVAPPPAPTVTSFTATPTSLPTGGGNVTLTWTTSGASTLAIDHGVGAVSGDSGSVVASVTTTTPFTLTATNAGGSTTSTAMVAVAGSGDRFVDAVAGADTNDCSQPSPCKTIAKAMTGAPSGSTVYLADGIYSPATQGNSATIADGVTLRATDAGAATIADNLILTAAGSAVLNGVVFGATNLNSPTCGGIKANSATGTPTLLMTGVLIECLDAVSIGGTVKATMLPGSLPGGVYTAAMPGGLDAMITVSNSADLQINGGIFDGNATGGSGFGVGWFVVRNNATMTLSGVTVRHRTQEVIALVDSASVSLTNNTLLTSVGVAGICGAAVIIGDTATLSLDHSQISNNPGGAICVNNGTSAATVNVTNGSTIAQNTVGIASMLTGATAVVTIDHSSFTNNGSGIDWNGFSGSSFTITSSTLTGNGTGISFQGLGGSLTLRSSNVSSNTGAGVFVGQAGATAVSADLGTQASPGLNTFTGNTSTGLSVGLMPGQTLQAVGNAWNASQQGADGNGHYSTAPGYAPVPKFGAQSGKNFGITNGGVTLDL